MRGMTYLRAVVVALTIAGLTASCGDDGATTGDTTTTTSTTTGSTTTSSTTTTSTTSTSSTTTSTEAPTSSTTTTLPGQPFDLGPAAGDVLAVIGVRFDDVLNVRRAPGTDQEIVAELPNRADDFVAAGRGRQLSESIWWEVTTADGTVGWVGSAFVAKTAATGDATARVIAALGTTPQAPDMSELGLIVAEAFVTDPEVPNEIVMTAAANEEGDLAEVTYDVVGLGDDSTRAVRAHVFGQPLESGDGFVLKTVEATDMCDATRGPGEDGVCV